MLFFYVCFCVILATYCLVMLSYQYWFRQLVAFETWQLPPVTTFTIIVPARNESANLPDLLVSLVSLDYPLGLWELIVVDDHSTDDTACIVSDFGNAYPNIQVIKLQDQVGDQRLNAYKKKAIDVAISKAKNEWIVTTDADCTVPKTWLKNLDAYIQLNEKVVFVGAPVAFTNDRTLFQEFQYLDFMGLQGITAAASKAGGHPMGNGANLAYKKSTFHAVGGFTGIDDVASGDDMLLMGKIDAFFPGRSGYLFHIGSVVETKPMDTLSGFLWQRIRWASKTHKIKDPKVKAILWAVLLFNMSLTAMPFLMVFDDKILAYWLLSLALKTVLEASFAVAIAKFFQTKLKWWFILFQLPHILYTSVSGFFGLIGKYQWKNRSVR